MNLVCDCFEATFEMGVERTLEPVVGDAATNTAVTRILEEALNKVVRHSGGSKIEISVKRSSELTTLEMRAIHHARTGRRCGDQSRH